MHCSHVLASRASTTSARTALSRPGTAHYHDSRFVRRVAMRPLRGPVMAYGGNSSWACRTPIPCDDPREKLWDHASLGRR